MINIYGSLSSIQYLPGKYVHIIVPVSWVTLYDVAREDVYDDIADEYRFVLELNRLAREGAIKTDWKDFIGFADGLILTATYPLTTEQGIDLINMVEERCKKFIQERYFDKIEVEPWHRLANKLEKEGLI